MRDKYMRDVVDEMNYRYLCVIFKIIISLQLLIVSIILLVSILYIAFIKIYLIKSYLFNI